MPLRLSYINENAPALTHLLRCPFYNSLARLTSFRDVMWHNVIPWRHMTSWHHRTGQDFTWSHSNKKVLRKSHFFVPMTLTFDLWPWPSNLYEILSRSILVTTLVTIRQAVWPMTLTVKLVRDFIKVNPCTNFGTNMSNCLAVRLLTNWQTGGKTERHTETRDRFYYLNRWRRR